jgi:uncharacterized membrane protein (DUF485 family)
MSAVFFLVLLLILAFEIWMFVDLIQNQSIPSQQKWLWAIGMFLLHPIVAIAYYFVARGGRSKGA